MSRLDAFGAQRHSRGRGAVAEQAAVEWLRGAGYRIVACNARTRAGEIDVVACEGETLCFVEIKARAGASYGPAVAAVGAAKQHRLRRAAALYLALHPWRGPCRFDVLGLDRAADAWRFTLLRNAFDA